MSNEAKVAMRQVQRCKANGNGNSKWIQKAGSSTMTNADRFSVRKSLILVCRTRRTQHSGSLFAIGWVARCGAVTNWPTLAAIWDIFVSHSQWLAGDIRIHIATIPV